jgi:hypothetical protein
MYCTKCGAENDDNAFRCITCHEVLQRVQHVSTDSDSAAMRLILPVGRSGLAIAAGYAGLFAILILPAPLALLLGILAVMDIKKHPEKHGMGRAIFAIIMGGIFSIGILFMLFAR